MIGEVGPSSQNTVGILNFDLESTSGIIETNTTESAIDLEGLPFKKANSNNIENDHIEEPDSLRLQYPKCSFSCKEDDWADKWCDSTCNNKLCGFDGGDCEGWCNESCSPLWINDTFCDAACYTSECSFDGSDCTDSVLPQKCSTECGPPWLGDGECDMPCDNALCFYDKNDCFDVEGTAGCRPWMVGNGFCDASCNNAAAHYDYGDCNRVTIVNYLNYTINPPDYQFCALDFIGDGNCDELCYNVESSWDEGDCFNTDFAKTMANQNIGPQFN